MATAPSRNRTVAPHGAEQTTKTRSMPTEPRRGRLTRDQVMATAPSRNRTVAPHGAEQTTKTGSCANRTATRPSDSRPGHGDSALPEPHRCATRSRANDQDKVHANRTATRPSDSRPGHGDSALPEPHRRATRSRAN